MGENSKIEWCDHTFNPWIGCQKVSPGCDHCYAEAMMDLRGMAGCSGDRTVSASELRMTTGGSRGVGQRTPTAGHGCSAPRSPIGSIIKRRANGGLGDAVPVVADRDGQPASLPKRA